MVVLALVGYVTDEDGSEKCIPVFVNPYRNSYYGIKPLCYKVIDQYTVLQKGNNSAITNVAPDSSTKTEIKRGGSSKSPNFEPV